MALSAHDAEEATRQLDGAILDAREAYSELKSGKTADDLINRQAELIAVQRMLIGKAIR